MSLIQDYLRGKDGAEALVGPFGEQLVGHKVDDIVVTFKYPYYNTDFDMKPKVITGDGSIEVTDSVMAVSSTTGSATADSKESVRYRAGHSGFVDFTGSFVGSGTGWLGGHDDSDGFFIKLNNGVASVGRRRGGVDTEIGESDWNGDIDPDIIDWTKINIFRIVFGYLGVANTAFMIRLNGWKVLHIMQTEGVLTTTHIGNPSFPIRAKTNGNMTIKTASWNAGTINGSDLYGARFFSFSGSKTLSGTNLATIAHFHNKTTYQTVANKVKSSLLRYRIYIDPPASGSGTVQVKVIKNATVTGTPNYTSIDLNNSITEYDTVVTYDTGGREIFTDWVGYTGSTAPSGADVGGSTQELAQGLGLYLLPDETATITAQNVAGTENVTVRIGFNWIELF